MRKNTFLTILISIIILTNIGGEVLATSGLQASKGEFENLAKTLGATTYGTPESLVGVVINIALTFAGLIFLILMIYAGYLWMTARGEDAQVEKATKIVSSTLIGFVLVAGAYSITTFIGKKVERGSTGNSASGECSQLGAGWKCDDIDSCLSNVNGYDLTAKVDTKRAFCDENNVMCQTGLCNQEDQGDEIICCKNGTDGGDPNKKVCIAECNYKSAWDFSTECDEDSDEDCKDNVLTEPDPELVEWVSETAYLAKKNVCDSKNEDCFVVELSDYKNENDCKTVKNLNCESLCLLDMNCGLKLLSGD